MAENNDTNNQNNTEDNQNNTQQNNTTGQKFSEVVLGCDDNGVNDEGCLTTVQKALESSGYKVRRLGIAPGPFADYSFTSEAKGKAGVYLMAASLVSMIDASHANFDYNVFGIRGDVTSWGTEEGFKTKGVPKDHHGDCTYAECDTYQGKTYPQLNEIYKGKCVAVPGETPDKLAQNIVAALGGQYAGSGGTTTGGTAAVNIPDVTFYGLIKQIIGGIDGVFIIANNLAYLLSFKDLYKYRDQYDQYIPIIKESHIIQDSLVKNWTTSGFYNSVEVTYADGIIKYQNDVLVKQYGENTFYYDFPDDDEETAKAKADALLAAHIRDYSTDIEMNIIYNERITEGSWIKLPKSVTKLSGKTRKEREQEALKKAGKPIPIKRKGVNITNMTEELVKQKDNTYKKMQHLVDEDGEKYDIELENSEYDLFFVQGFTCRWSAEHSLMMSIHLKYGPDTPQDPINATIATGEVAQTSGGVAGGTPNWGDDCFSICDICIQNCEKILPYGGGRRTDAEEYIRKHEPEASYLGGRAKQDSTYAKEVSGKTPQEAYTLFRSKFDYACYSDSCDGSYRCCEDLWTKANAANCGDSTRMLKALMDATGAPCYGIHVDGHYFNAVQVSGTWHTLDGTRGPENSSCNFPDSGNYGSGSNACGSGWC